MMPIRQTGAALFVSLIILLLVSIIGVSSLRSTVFQERMAFNSQLKNITFQGAESGIGAVLSAMESDGELLTAAYKGTELSPHVVCITYASGLVEGDCGDGQSIDSRGLLKVTTKSYFVDQKLLSNTDQSAFLDYEFATRGMGAAIQTTAFDSESVQQWKKVAPAQQFSDYKNLLGY